MSLYVNSTGKLLGAAIASWVGAKLLTKYAESQEPPPKASLDGIMPQSLQDSLTACALAGDQRGFTALLDANGCPQDFKMRNNLWNHFGGD